MLRLYANTRKSSLYRASHSTARSQRDVENNFLEEAAKTKQKFVAKGRSVVAAFLGGWDEVVRHKHMLTHKWALRGVKGKEVKHNEIPCWRREKSI